MYISDHIITSKHYLVHFVCFFALGIYLATSFGIVISAGFVCVFLILSLSVYPFLRRQKKAKKKHIVLPLVLTFAALLGIFRIYYTDYAQSSYLHKYNGKELWLCGTVSADPYVTSAGYYYAIELEVFGAADRTGDFGTIMLYIPFDYGCELTIGDNIYTYARLESPEKDSQSMHLDYLTQLRGKSIFMTATTKNINLLSGDATPSPGKSLINAGVLLRNKVTHSIDGIFPDNSFYSAVLKGILVGDKSDFDSTLFQRFSYSGISHIVAVSGLHMSILFSFLMIASRRFGLNKKFNIFITIPAILLFVSASAFTPSVCRASIMILIMICSTLLREEYNPVTSLFLALGLILSAVPYSLFSKSLVLSFGATLGIFVYFPLIYKSLADLVNTPRLQKPRRKLLCKFLLYLSSSVSLTLSSLIGTAYFLTLFFGSISKVQLFTNLWVIPTVMVIFCLGYVCCILYCIYPPIVTAVLKYPLACCLEIIEFTVNKFGTAENVLIIPESAVNGISAIVYFGIALMLYKLLKAYTALQTAENVSLPQAK